VEKRDMEMTPDTIRALLDAFDRSDWREMTVTIGADRLHVSRDEPTLNGAGPVAAVPVPAAAPAPPAETEASGQAGERASGSEMEPEPESAPEAAPAATATGTMIEAPSVGLFWRAPAPGAPPFVEVGSRVAAGDTLAIVEVMKLMNHVVSPVDGVVVGILVENGAPVEFGQPIVAVDPEA
jgi:acetyl-CoA carboxylase biotin carboxyl carrier protein